MTRLHDVGSGGDRIDTAGQAHSWQRQIQAGPRNLKIRVVKDIENFSPEFQVGRFRKPESLVEDQIELTEAGAAEEISRHIAESARGGCGERRRIQSQSIDGQIRVRWRVEIISRLRSTSSILEACPLSGFT